MRQRRASFASETYIPFSNLSKLEQSQFASLYKKCDQKDGGISFYDFITILKSTCLIIPATFEFGEQKKKEILNEILIKTIRILDLQFLLTTASSLKKQKQFNNEHKPLTGEFFDAFVALGGNLDGSGFITKNSLLNIMINEFDLKVDLDALDLKGMNQQRLNYDQFCQLFENPENTLIRTDSVQSVRINPQDFDNYLSKLTI